MPPPHQKKSKMLNRRIVCIYIPIQINTPPPPSTFFTNSAFLPKSGAKLSLVRNKLMSQNFSYLSWSNMFKALSQICTVNSEELSKLLKNHIVWLNIHRRNPTCMCTPCIPPASWPERCIDLSKGIYLELSRNIQRCLGTSSIIVVNLYNHRLETFTVPYISRHHWTRLDVPLDKFRHL